MNSQSGSIDEEIARDEHLPTVLVVIPTLNEERYIRRCLEGLMALDYPKDRLRIRVVDNYSTDRTVEIANKYRVEAVQSPKSTIARTRNVGARDANEEVVAFLDADCVPATRWLRHGVRYFATEDVVAVGCYPAVIAEESNTLQKTWSEMHRRAGVGVKDASWLPSANLLVRREAFHRMTGFNEALTTCEDVDLSYRLAKVGRVIWDPDVLVYHLREPATLKDLFRKEVWHARNNFSGIASHGLRWREAPSLLAPIAFGGGAILGVFGLVAGSDVLLFGFSLSLLTVLVYTVRALPKTARVDAAIAIYAVYFSARFYAALREARGAFRRHLADPQDPA